MLISLQVTRRSTKLS